MPIQRVDKKFVDVSFSFKKHPFTNDILTLRDENAIKRSILNLVFTNQGERFFNPLIGSNIRDYLFGLGTDETIIGLEDTIKQVLKNYEPRIDVKKVESVFSEENNSCDVTITYNILGSEVVPQNLKFILKENKS